MKPNRTRAKDITTKLTVQELATIRRAADLAALPPTAYMRTRCLAEARRELPARMGARLRRGGR